MGSHAAAKYCATSVTGKHGLIYVGYKEQLSLKTSLFACC